MGASLARRDAEHGIHEKYVKRYILEQFYSQNRRRFLVGVPL
jgi:hypothetical protein